MGSLKPVSTLAWCVWCVCGRAPSRGGDTVCDSWLETPSTWDN